MKIILVDAAYTFTNHANEIDQGVYALLEQYPNNKIILTNANEEQMKEYGLVDLPYELFTLRHEPNKDDPEYFKKFFSEYSLSPDEVVYFEHSPAAVRSARSLGVTSYHFDDEERDLVALKEFLDQNL